MGWATAWSFDRLRLWLEEGIDPTLAARQTTVHSLARVTLALLFAYQGLVPKLLYRHADEIAMLRDTGIGTSLQPAVLSLLGIAEVAFALLLVLLWRRRWPIWITLALMALATAVVAAHSPPYLHAAFNPVSLNLVTASLSAIDLIVLRGLPSASNCKRRPSPAA